jgi:8-oxo-dGTP pyrophosphatase MutT (NUDIX family)
MFMNEEKVDILAPPLFEKSGEIKTRDAAFKDGDWVATFNLWIVRTEPKPAIICQRLSANKLLAPGKLDIAAGGHLRAGEEPVDGLREAREELGKNYRPEDLRFIGRRLFVGVDKNGARRNNVVYIFITVDNTPLESYKLDGDEVDGIFALPLGELEKMWREGDYSFRADGLDASGRKTGVTVSRRSFMENWDPYHQKMCRVARRFLNGERDLIY